MDFILESPKSLSILDRYVHTPTFVGIIPAHDQYHPKLNSVVALFIGFVGSKDSYIIPIKHSECENYSVEQVVPYLKNFKYLFTLSKKEYLYYFSPQQIHDVNLIATLLEGSKPKIHSPVTTIDTFYRIHSDFYEVNTIVPIGKLHEKWQHIFNSIKRYLTVELPPYYEFYNTSTTRVYYMMEQQGIKVTDKFATYYPDIDLKFNAAQGKVYTWYNPYTATTRPSNTFNRVNFAALNKESGVREEIISEFDYLVEFDYDGSHVRLICDQIGYKLTEAPAHEQLANLYFPEQEITPDLYAQSKRISFAAFYGNIPPKYRHLEVFIKLEKYLKELQEGFQKQGYIKDPYTGRPVYIEGKDSPIQKLLNYSIQSLEASRNVVVLEKLLKYLRNKKSKVILYTYDAFLIDFSKQDEKTTLSEIKELLSEQGRYPVKFKYGKTLNFKS